MVLLHTMARQGDRFLLIWRLGSADLNALLGQSSRVCCTFDCEAVVRLACTISTGTYRSLPSHDSVVILQRVYACLQTLRPLFLYTEWEGSGIQIIDRTLPCWFGFLPVRGLNSQQQTRLADMAMVSCIRTWTGKSSIVAWAAKEIWWILLIWLMDKKRDVSLGVLSIFPQLPCLLVNLCKI